MSNINNSGEQTKREGSDNQPAESQNPDTSASVPSKGLTATAGVKTVNATADILGYSLGAINVGIVGALRTVKAAWRLFMFPLKHASALGYTGFSAFVIGTGFVAKKAGNAAGHVYRPLSPYVNKAAGLILPPIGQAAILTGKGLWATIKAVSPIVTIPAKGIKAAAILTGKGLKAALSPVHKIGERFFPKTTEKGDRIAKLIGDHKPIDAIAYPMAGMYMVSRGIYKVVYGVLDVSARFVGRRLYNNFPKTSQNVLDGYGIVRDSTQAALRNLPPEKAFGAVAVMSALAYAISPVVGSYYTIYAANELIRSTAIILPKILKVASGAVTYLCWEQARQSRGFATIKNVYDPFSEAITWIRSKMNNVDIFCEKRLAGYKLAKSAIDAKQQEQPEPKQYEAKLAKLGAKIIPGYRRADHHQEWMTNYVVSTRAYQLGERGFHASVSGLQYAWQAVAPYHKKAMAISARATATLPGIKMPFNEASGFSERMWQKHAYVMETADQTASKLAVAFGIAEIIDDAATPENHGKTADKVTQDNTATAQKDSHAPL